jgi:catalase
MKKSNQNHTNNQHKDEKQSHEEYIQPNGDAHMHGFDIHGYFSADESSKDVAKKCDIKNASPAYDITKSIQTDLKPVTAARPLFQAAKNFSGRRVGILIEDGANALILKHLLAEIENEKASYTLIGCHAGEIMLNNHETLVIHTKIEGSPSALFDSIAIFLSDSELLHPKLYEFIWDAYFHCKYIGYVPSFAAGFKRMFHIIKPDAGFIELDRQEMVTQFIVMCRDLRFWQRMMSM